MKENIIPLICARGASKGIPNKNIIDFCGKPLIGWAIEQAKSLKFVDEIFVSTDSDQISEIATKFGGKVIFKRPKELSYDDTSEFLVWKHAIQEIEKYYNKSFEFLLSIPTTSPLRANKDIERCIEKLMNSKADCVTCVTTAHRNPYFNMIKIDQIGNVHKVMQPEKDIYRRQDAPEVYDVTTVAFAAKTKFIKSNDSIYDGTVKAIKVPVERSIDIDTKYDLKLAELIHKNYNVINE